MKYKRLHRTRLKHIHQRIFPRRRLPDDADSNHLRKKMIFRLSHREFEIPVPNKRRDSLVAN